MMHFNKSSLLIFMLFSVVCFTSCKKWLNVNPATQIKEEEQFKSQQGFADALFGVYQISAAPNGYGAELTYGLLDVLAQRYENKASSTTNYFGEAARYNYTAGASGNMNVRGVVEGIWSNQYKAIAQANLILKNVDANKGVLTPQAYALVKGEALALRGFLHFDLARMYAPAYRDGANAQAAAIPYVELFTVAPQARISLAAVLEKCETDLKKADTILSAYPEIDQIAGNQGSASLELLTAFRQNHLNNWAVKGILARLYLYRNDKPNAYKYAKEVIAAKKFRFVTQAELNVDATTTASDLTFSMEHLYSVYVSGLKAAIDVSFKASTSTTAIDPADYVSTTAKLNTIYESSVAGYGTELRSPAASKSVWNTISPTLVYTKKYYSDNPANVKQRIIPVLRLSEMYYIAAEASPTTVEGFTWLNEVRKARLIPELATTGTDDMLQAELLKEYRKEFYGEGQLWFYYKRKNTANIPDGVGNPMNESKYVFPLPNAELEFGK